MEIQKISKKSILENVKVENEMFSLTDLWKLAGSPKNKRPIDWQEKESTSEFIDALQVTFSSAKKALLKTKRGKGAGTYGHKSIALSYAKYLDPKIHILVNEVFFERIEEEKNPDLAIDRAIKSYERKGMDPKWISKRLHAKGIRNLFTKTLQKHGVAGDGYKRCTDAVYIGLFGKEAKEIREARSLPASCNLRENLSSLELSAISLAEELAMEDISRKRLYGNQECSVSSNRASRSVSQSILNFRQNG